MQAGRFCPKWVLTPTEEGRRQVVSEGATESMADQIVGVKGSLRLHAVQRPRLRAAARAEARGSGGLGLVFALCALVGSFPVAAQEERQIEDWEFASTDQNAERGVTDLTHPQNWPTLYISGADDKASEGEFSIGTDVVYCRNPDYDCLPGTFEGFRRWMDSARWPDACAGEGHFVPLAHTYGDPDHPGPDPPDHPIAELRVLGDFYGDGGFADGLTGTHLWVNLVDCEGEIFNYVNYSEVSLYSELWTFDVFVGSGLIGLDPRSLDDVPDGDRLLTEIAAVEVLIQDEDDPPTTFGKWYIDDLRIIEPPVSSREGDFDEDGDVDLADFARLYDCMRGPGTPVEGDCTAADLDSDSDVDLADAVRLMVLFDGGV